jgi:hypothetical protein
MSENLNRRSTDSVAPHNNTPEWLNAVVTIAPLAMSFFQMIMTLVNARPPKVIPTTPAMPLIKNDTDEPAGTR